MSSRYGVRGTQYGRCTSSCCRPASIRFLVLRLKSKTGLLCSPRDRSCLVHVPGVEWQIQNVDAMQNPRWKQLLTESLSKSVQENKDSVTYCLSTISSKSNPLPESRFIVHRGFVNERRKPDDPSSNSVEAGSSASLLACTDIRSPKVDQIIARNSSSVQEGRSASICWWLQPTGEQYRIQARAYIIPPPSLISKLPTFPVGQELSPSTSFDWEEERLRIFEKLSPDLKASFLRPPPGNELTKKEVAKDWPDKLDDEKSKSTALENFALIVFDPVSVDLVRLKTTPHERFKWARNTLGEWEETELVP